tara:strand:+ start:15002 stop:16453 length:1452 start_codon:yes stop_codon:yes gene_type:complete
MDFVVIRLGKDSLEDIARLDSPDPQVPFSFTFQCAQVEQNIEPGAYAFLCLGSDNNKGIDTKWKRGLRALGKILELERGTSFNDTSTLKIEVLSVFNDSLDQFDFLDKSSTLYKHFSGYPVIGVKSSRNNAIQRVRDDPRENTSALLTAIKMLYPPLVDDLSERAPELIELLDFVPSPEETGDASLKIDDDDPILKKIQDAIVQRNQRNFLFLGTPGTGKTWYAHRIASSLTGSHGHRIAFLQFHPSISYDDFIEGYVPSLSTDKTSIKYEIRPKHFLKLCDAASADADNIYVIVIDEISRGDPSRVFGELLTYIEPEYRERTFSLGYSGRDYRIPRNVVILATANPYDRSVGELDDAFLRRFEMVEFPPDRNVLSNKLEENGMPKAGQQRVVHFFDTLNKTIPNGIGHSYFLTLKTADELKELWENKLAFIVRRSLQYDGDSWNELLQKFETLFGEPAADEEDVPPTEVLAVGEQAVDSDGA